MAGATVTIEARIVDAGAQAALHRLLAVDDDLEPVLLLFGEYLLEAHEDRYRQQVAPDGTPWEPLSEKYRRRKPKNKDLILVLDGFMKDTYRYDLDRDTLVFGSDRIYAATHHFGDDSRGIPARPHIGVSEADEARLAEIATDYLQALLQG